jgi:hypothetical protein
MKKSQNMPGWLRKMVLAQQHIIPLFALAGERSSNNVVHLQKRKECNKLDLTAAQCF